MRYLTVVRHAKATPATPGASDFDRGLSERGKSQCEQLRAWSKDKRVLGLYGPATALVSAAARTRETYQRSFAGTTLVQSVSYSELIYNGLKEVSAEDLLIDLAAIDPVTTSLLVVAHNPTVLEVMYVLAKKLPHSLRRDRYPLGGAYVLELPGDAPIGLARYEVVEHFVPD